MKCNLLERVILYASAFSLAVAFPLAAQETQAPPQNPPAQQQAQAASEPAKAPAGKIVVPAGTRLPLVLHNSLTTRNAKPGDQVFLEVLFPILVGERVVIPAGSYVYGEVVEAKRPGRAKGRGELLLRMTRMLLPNGYVVSFSAMPSGAGTGGNEEVDKEGKVKGDTDRMADVWTVLIMGGMGTGVGSGIGGIAGSPRMGAGVGAAAGLGAGLATVLLSRGPEVELPRGSTLDITLNRALYLDADRVNFTDPGQASQLAGPPNRQPQRRRFPY